MSEVGLRLAEIRRSRGLSQSALGKIGGVSLNTQGNYENGTRSPDSRYLTALHEAGIDVAYVLTGERAIAEISSDERRLLYAFARLGEPARATILTLVEQMVAGGLVQVQTLHASTQTYRSPEADLNRD